VTKIQKFLFRHLFRQFVTKNGFFVPKIVFCDFFFKHHAACCNFALFFESMILFETKKLF